jgi:hypothetical protein
MIAQRPGVSLPFMVVHGLEEWNEIPPMTDPLGKHWQQPADIRHAPMDGEHVLLTKSQIDALPEYSSSYPSGTYDGKCWKREGDGFWWLCWYYPNPKPNTISIGSRIIIEKEKNK